MPTKQEYLNPEKIVEHIDITKLDVVDLVDAMGKTAFQARNLYRAANILTMMENDKNCAVIMTLAGSLISAGMKKIVIDMMKANMIDVIVSTGAIIVDQDFFEAIGYKHYQGTQARMGIEFEVR